MLSLAQKLKMQKKHAKNVSTTHFSCSMQKTTPENNIYSKTKTILKIATNGHQVKAIGFSKYSLWLKN